MRDAILDRTPFLHPKREHNLHIFGGDTFDDIPSAERGLCIVSHSRTPRRLRDAA